MRRIAYSVGCFIVVLFLCAGFLLSYQMSELKDRIGRLEEDTAAVQQKVSAPVQEKDRDFIFERYENGKWEKDVYKMTAYGAKRVIFCLESPEKKTAFTDREQEFFLKLENGYVVVYDKATNEVYEYTDIALETLPEKLRSEVLLGKTVKNQDDLYDFLENYSS